MRSGMKVTNLRYFDNECKWGKESYTWGFITLINYTWGHTCTTLIKCSLFFYSWVGLVSKNYEIERACVELEKEVTSIEQKKAKVKLLGLKIFFLF